MKIPRAFLLVVMAVTILGLTDASASPLAQTPKKYYNAQQKKDLTAWGAEATIWKRRLLVGTMIVTVIAVLVLLFVTTIPNASSSITLLDDQTLEAKALEWARVNGLQGNPISKRIVHMTLSQWFALLKQQLGPDSSKFGLIPDMPVFILAIRGKVERRDSQSPLQGQTTPEQFDNITVAVDARNGKPISVGSARDPSMMPIPVPLSALTPTAPVRYAPTQPPVTPPTLAPRATPTATSMPSVLATPTLPVR